MTSCDRYRASDGAASGCRWYAPEVMPAKWRQVACKSRHAHNTRKSSIPHEYSG